jgi:hypothetical protein
VLEAINVPPACGQDMKADVFCSVRARPSVPIADLPTFYVFKAGVFSGSMDPSVWLSTGVGNWQSNFAKDEFDLLRVWLPADLVCFSVPLYLRLPVRHVVSFVWTAYLSFARGGH